jgi:signal transduction histidine kinase
MIYTMQNISEQLAKSNQIKDEFLAVLSHELRTSLNPILGWVQLLRHRKFDQAGLEDVLEVIGSEILRQATDDDPNHR